MQELASHHCHDTQSSEKASTSRGNSRPVPLVVDLDGTMITGDSLWEAIAILLRTRPLYLVNLPYWLLKGRCHFKKRVAEVSPLDPSQVAINHPLLDFIIEEKKLGRKIILATGSHHLSAKRFERHIGVFDEIISSDEGINLTGSKKRDHLIGRFGEGNFDYVGNSNADFPVWAVCREIHVANPGPLVLRRLRSLGVRFRTHGPCQSYPRELIRELRVHQWVKNFLVFVPLLASHRFGSTEIAAALVAFVCFNLCASSVYLLNDLLDLRNDRGHPTKRFRPAALGTIPLSHVFFLCPVLFFTACLISTLTLPLLFSGLLVAYYAATAAYSFRLKRIAIADVLTLALLYTMRIIGGAYAIAVAPSQWILAFSILIFTSLAFAKRYAEIKEVIRQGLSSGPNDVLPGRGYRLGDGGKLRPLGLGAGYGSVVIAAFYILDSHTRTLYPAFQFLWLIPPLLAVWISRLWLFAHLGILHSDPVLFAIRDKFSLICGAILLGVFALAALA